VSRALDDLSDDFRPLAVELLARCVEAGIAVVVVDTLRTPEEHAQNLLNGTSWTTHSKHLDGDAIDIAPFETYALHGGDKIRWDASDTVWRKIGMLGEALGLRWGGRWTIPDLGHFELVRPPTP
jgi:hypothetical protein